MEPVDCSRPADQPQQNSCHQTGSWPRYNASPCLAPVHLITKKQSDQNQIEAAQKSIGYTTRKTSHYRYRALSIEKVWLYSLLLPHRCGATVSHTVSRLDFTFSTSKSDSQIIIIYGSRLTAHFNQSHDAACSLWHATSRRQPPDFRETEEPHAMCIQGVNIL